MKKFYQGSAQMNYSKVLIVGLNSSIASFVLPALSFNKEIVYGISRGSINKELGWIKSDHIFISDYPFTKKFMEKVGNDLSPQGTENVLVLNFSGFFGEPATLRKFVMNDVVDVLNKNLIQFLALSELFLHFPQKSFLIGFSGGGVGGENMDGSSLGYLLSKISLAGLSEILDRDLMEENKRVALIAPGPFPSVMQSAVANAPMGAVSEASRNQAAQADADEEKIAKLTRAIKWVAENPNESGGRIWSAQRDDFSMLQRSKNFGFLRRVID